MHGHQDWPHPDLLEQARHQTGLAINFRWESVPHYLGVWPDVNGAYACAGQASRPLAGLVNLLGQLAPGRKIDLMVHSLGARVGFQALHQISAGNLGRFVTFAGVEFNAITLAALHKARPSAVSFYNITSAQVPFMHRAMHHLGPRPGPADALIARGFAFPRRNWIDIHMQEPQVSHPVQQLCAGLATGPAFSSLIARFGSAILQNRGDTSVDGLKTLLGPAVPQPLTLYPVRSPKAVDLH